MRQHFRSLAFSVIAVALATSVAGCSRDIKNHGSQLDEERLQSIRPGSHTKDNVMSILGSPASVATFDEDAWYYISGQRELRTPFADEEMERLVFVVRFSPNGVVSEVDRFGLERSQNVEFVERETPSSGQSITVIQQLLGNVGRFDDD